VKKILFIAGTAVFAFIAVYLTAFIYLWTTSNSIVIADYLGKKHRIVYWENNTFIKRLHPIWDPGFWFMKTYKGYSLSNSIDLKFLAFEKNA